MPDLIGLTAGTVFYHKDYFQRAEKKMIDTPHGQALVLLADQWAYVPRHGLDGQKYIHAYRVNHAANMAALKELGVKEVIGVNSTGSLRPSLEPGSVVLPNDYISLGCVITVYDDKKSHITPRLSEPVRNKLIEAARIAEVHIVEGGIYWQNPGPRLETRAEIMLMAHYADMVGMTLASEAVVAQEMDLEYASLCSVDNHGHGLSPSPLTSEEIMANAAANAGKIFQILNKYSEK